MSAPDLPEPVSPSPNPLGDSQARGHRHLRRCEPFRFLQASDFRLDTPCFGALDLPDSLRNRFVDARYLAAERVFDAAIQQEVDFLLLSGGLLDARLPGLRGPWFLSEQFHRLADHGIAIYWAGSSLETQGRWPVHADLPASVHRLVADTSGKIHRRQGQPLACLLTIPASEIETFPALSNEQFTIALQPRSSRVPQRWEAGIDYWALGGQSHHETEQVGDVVAHFAGSPQGGSPSESGRHSCSLVTVNAKGAVQIEPIATNVVRWQHERLKVSATTSWSELEQQLKDWSVDFPADPATEIVMVRFSVTGRGLAVQRLLEPRFNAQLLHRLNANQTNQCPTFWTIGIDPIVDASAEADSASEPTPLEAFLRELQGMEEYVEELFGEPHHGPHLRRLGDMDADGDPMQHVCNEGVYRLGTNEPSPVIGTI